MEMVVAFLFLIAAFVFLCFLLLGKANLWIELIVALDVFGMAILLAAWVSDLWQMNPLLAMNDILVIISITSMAIVRLVDAKKEHDKTI